jgi:hypothetical protein
LLHTATIYQLYAFGTQAFNGQLNFPGTVTCRQPKVMRSLEVIKTDHLRATQAFKVSMLLGMFVDVGTKTPDSIRTHQPMHKAFLVQPIQHTIERDPVKPVFVLQSLFNFVMRDSPPLGQQHGKDMNPSGGNTLPAVTDHLFGFFLKINQDNGFATQLRLL